MKNKLLILVGLVALLAASCTKTNSAPNSNAHTTPPVTTTSTSTTTASGAECMLYGHWVFDSIVFYSNDIETSSVLPSAANRNNFVYDLTGTAYGSGSNYAGYLSLTYEVSGGIPNNQYWFVDYDQMSSIGFGILKVGAVPYMAGNIYKLVTNQLIITSSTSTVKNGEYFYFHK